MNNPEIQHQSTLIAPTLSVFTIFVWHNGLPFKRFIIDVKLAKYATNVRIVGYFLKLQWQCHAGRANGGLNKHTYSN